MITINDIENNTSSFRSYMEEIDSRLRAAGIPIHARPIQALFEISKDGMSIILGDISSNSHAEKINEWFKQRYGNRLQVDWSIGKAVILVRGDPFIVKLPLAFGTVAIDATKTFVDLTKHYFADLSDSDRSNIVSAFAWLYESFTEIEHLPNSIQANIATAVLQLTNQSPHYGEAQWASLQAAEKTLKTFIKARGHTPARTHILEKLLKKAEELGLEAGLWPLLTMIQCSADVRYDAKVSLEQAVISHHASIDLCAVVGKQIRQLGPSTSRGSRSSDRFAISFAYGIDMTNPGALLFCFVLSDGAELSVHIPPQYCFSLLKGITQAVENGRYSDDSLTTLIDNYNVFMRPRSPTQIFRANRPSEPALDFSTATNTLSKIESFTNALALEVTTSGDSKVRVLLVPTLVRYFADCLRGGISAGRLRGLFEGNSGQPS